MNKNLFFAMLVTLTATILIGCPPPDTNLATTLKVTADFYKTTAHEGGTDSYLFSLDGANNQVSATQPTNGADYFILSIEAVNSANIPADFSWDVSVSENDGPLLPLSGKFGAGDGDAKLRLYLEDFSSEFTIVVNSKAGQQNSDGVNLSEWKQSRTISLSQSVAKKPTEGEGEGEGEAVVAGLPVITTQPPATLSADVGEQVTISLTATGATSYQWYDNSVAITEANWPEIAKYSSGWNTNTLVIFSCGTLNAGFYQCKVTNSAGTILSSGCKLTITNGNGAVTEGEGEGEGETGGGTPPGSDGGRVKVNLTATAGAKTLTGVFDNFSSKDFSSLFINGTGITMGSGLQIKLCLFYIEKPGNGSQPAKTITGTVASDGKTITWDLGGLTTDAVKTNWKITMIAVTSSKEYWLNTGMLDAFWNGTIMSRLSDGNYAGS